MIIHFDKSVVEKIVENEGTVYAQIPFINRSYFDFDSDTEHLITMDVDKGKVISSEIYHEGYYPFYRHKDLEIFKNLLFDESYKAKTMKE